MTFSALPDVAFQRRCSHILPGAKGDLRSASRAGDNEHPAQLPSSLGRGASRAWGPVCTLVLLLLCLAATVQAAPPGTPIANTAQATYLSWGISTNSYSNTVTTIVDRYDTPSQIELLQYAPALAGATLVPVPTTEYSDTGTTASSVAIAAIYPAGSAVPIDLSAPVPLTAASVYHQGEPVFFRVSDMDQNRYPAAAETIWLLATVPGTSEAELLLLTETGPNTGIFAGYIQSGNLGVGTLDDFNGVLDVSEGLQIEARYTDTADPADSVVDNAMVDPYGLVFDSATGLPVDNVQLTLLADATGAPATVYGDDGISAFPSTITSGGTFTDAGGKVYAFAAGCYRFPFVAPGTYRLVISPPSGYAAPSTVAAAVLQTLPGAPFAIAAPGSRGEAFVLNPGPAIRMDIPVDPAVSGLWVQKSVSRTMAAIGDFVQYTVTVENNSGAPAANATVNDRLPLGFRYRQGSARLDGGAVADPQTAPDGRTLTFAIGTMAADATARIQYVTEVAAGAKPGRAENLAGATAGGGLQSNTAIAAVTVKEDLFRSKNFIVGRVMADNCNDDPTDKADGVPGVRIYLEDGTFVITDGQGRYHFEGVTSGTRVVQMDLKTLPPVYEAAACEKDTRWAATPFSRFVDLHGGTLWRADFHVQTKAPPSGQAHLKMTCGLEDETVAYHAHIDVRDVPVENRRLTILLPQGGEYVPGSSRKGAKALDDPRMTGGALIYRLGDAAADQTDILAFKVRLGDAAQAGRLHTKAMMTFNTPQKKNQRTQVVDTVLALRRRRLRQVQEPIVVRPRFHSLSATLTAGDRQMLDRLAERLKSVEIEHVVVTGHTDNRQIRPGENNRFPDNDTLSLVRARNAAAYLAERLSLTKSQVTIVGRGADQPLADNGTEEGRAANRRVEVKVMSVKVKLIHDIASIKCEDQVVTPTQGRVHPLAPAMDDGNAEEPPVQRLEDIDLNALAPGNAWLMPAADFNPPIPSVKLAVQHDPMDNIELLLNGRPVSPLNFDGRRYNGKRTVAVSYWRGVDIGDGDNHFVAIFKNRDGEVTQRMERLVHYAGPAVKIELAKTRSRLIANGKDAPLVAVRLTDKDGYPARFGTSGELLISSPYQVYADKENMGDASLTRLKDESPRYIVGRDGIAVIQLEPTTQSGYVTITIPLADKDHEVRAWLQPELRDWILVGLAEGTVGYHTVSGNMENLNAGDRDEDFYQDGRMAFFAKGKVKGKWLLTAAYDSGRERADNDTGLFQTIDPDTYYTLYGDGTRQQNEAPSVRKLYLKIEREQFYALFGDYDTGLSVTELSKYSRRFNGIKSEFVGRKWGYTAFATDTDQAFIKDEIRGNGTSGVYRLSRRSIVPNSETVTIETRDRFRSEIIISSQTLSRRVDYRIDYDAGTIIFKTPVFSRDAFFNPTYIVASYESRDASEESYVYGGRGSVQLAGGKVALGATYIHEDPRNAEADLGGVDARIELGNGLQIKAEAAATSKDNAGEKINGHAYLAEIGRHSADLDAKVYIREQGEGFGLGQQNGSEAATRKIGADAAWSVSAHWHLSGELYRQNNLATQAERDLAEARVEYHQPVYHLYTGLRLAEDRFDNSDANRSTQLLLGGSRRFLDNRLQARVTHEQSLPGNNASVDFPTRTVIGADYRIVEPVTLYAEHEIAQGEQETSQSSRLGLKATPWTGGRIGSSVGRAYGENSQRVFANLGLTQTWRINHRWSVDGGLDRTQTLHKESDQAPFNSNVPVAAGAEADFTSISLGAAYRADRWSWTGRVESRTADSEDKWGVITGIAGEVRRGLGVSAGLEIFRTEAVSGAQDLEGRLRLSLARRPKNTRWIVLDRLDYKFEHRKDGDEDFSGRRIVNNLNANYRPHHKLQVAMQYGAKYVFDTIDGRSYEGYTDLTGMEARYDLTRHWDVGAHAGVLHSWNAGQLDYRTGCSVGYAMMKNMWVSLGYNFTGFKDEDFSEADYTAAGPYLKLRLKFDQRSVRDMVNWFDTQ